MALKPPLHMQSLITTELRFPNRSRWSSFFRGSTEQSSDAHTLRSDAVREKDGRPVETVLEGDTGGVGSSSNFFQMSSLGAVDVK